jgi:tetratricopeptide (TPR) repeat protein
MFGRACCGSFLQPNGAAYGITSDNRGHSRVTDDQSPLGDPNNRLRHRVFFVAAGEMREGSPEYRAMLAGLLVLRLLAKWPEPSGTTSDDNAARIQDFVPVKNHIEAMDDTPVKRVLSGLLEAVSNFSYGQPDSRIARLIAYGQFLEDGEYWEPAADTYGAAIDLITAGQANTDLLPMCYARAAHCERQVPHLLRAHELLSTGIEIATKQHEQARLAGDDVAIAHADYWLARMRIAIATLAGELLEDRKEWESAAAIYVGAIELIIATAGPERVQLPRWYERAAYCLRQIGDIMRAKDMLHDGIEVASELHDLRTALYLRISAAVVDRQTGDLPQAEYALDSIIGEAKNAGERELVARATHERGVVAHDRHQYTHAVEFFREAAGLYSEERMSRRALTDLAMSLGELGHHDYAMKVFRAVWRAPETEVEPRDVAGLNLMRGSFVAGDRVTFNRLRTELNYGGMSGRLRAHYWLFVGQGQRRFGDLESARTAIEEAIRLAEEYSVRTLLTEAKAVLSAIDDRPIPWRDPEDSPTLAALFAEIDEGRGMFAGAIAA